MKLNDVIKALSVPALTKYDALLLFEDNSIFVNSSILNGVFTNIENNLPPCCLSLVSAKALAKYTDGAKITLKDETILIAMKGTRLKIPILNKEVKKIEAKTSKESIPLTPDVIEAINKCVMYTTTESSELGFSDVHLNNQWANASNRAAIISVYTGTNIKLSLNNLFTCPLVTSIYALENDVKIWKNQSIKLKSKNAYCEITSTESDVPPFDIDDIILKYVGEKQKIPFELLPELLELTKIGSEFGATENYQINIKFVSNKILISTNTGKNAITKTISAKHEIEECIVINKMQAEMLPKFFDSNASIEILGKVQNRVLLFIHTDKIKFYMPAMIGKKDE